MNLTTHELSIGLSLQRPISKQDIARRDEWMDHHTEELFSLAKEALMERARLEHHRDLWKNAAIRCDECATTGQHSTAECPFPAKHIPLFPEA